jgi:hypothetical protein
VQLVKNSNIVKLSTLNKTWLLDLDGTLFIHNSYKEGADVLVEGVKEFFRNNVQKDDLVIGLTSRKDVYKEITLESIKKYNLKIDQVIFNLPYGERILINDRKPSGLVTAIAINTIRDRAIDTKFVLDNNL